MNIQVEWPHHPRVKALSTTRLGGCSKAPYSSLNLGDHVQDDPGCVEQNRQALVSQANLPVEPMWLQQTHSQIVIESEAWQPKIEADGSIARAAGAVCLVMTADCLPILLADQNGSVVSAVHAGWRGLCDGILETAVGQMAIDPAQIHVWIGPAISGRQFEVGAEVRQAFLDAIPNIVQPVEFAFVAGKTGHYMADLVKIATLRLNALGVHSVHGGQWCTYENEAQFFSYRRDGVTGRMATLIWLQD
ncbi:MAG: peptidoglycan editing factor PgeF [Methylococcales bacterium]|jgi:polyphenol oxidase|nr:peptidoglycan editing factor PgeF [Methylococcales bacterium]MBT7443065.1 peptidoglycan editing factor PgeF [Methylococcales bacterium]